MRPVSATGRARRALRRMRRWNLTRLSMSSGRWRGTPGAGHEAADFGRRERRRTVHVASEQPDALELSIAGGKRIVELCTFSANASRENGNTLLRVEASHSRMLGFIPGCPKFILGYDLDGIVTFAEDSRSIGGPLDLSPEGR